MTTELPSSQDIGGGTTSPISTIPIVPKVIALHQKVIMGLSATLNELKARGIVCGMESGLRTSEMQQHEYDKGRTVINPDGISKDKPMGNIVTNAKPWTSWHCFGLAVDITPMNSRGQFYWWPDEDKRWAEVANVAKMFGFEWGGNWATFSGDLDHFQMRGKLQSVFEAKQILFEKGIEAVWELV